MIILQVCNVFFWEFIFNDCFYHTPSMWDTYRFWKTHICKGMRVWCQIHCNTLSILLYVTAIRFFLIQLWTPGVPIIIFFSRSSRAVNKQATQQLLPDSLTTCPPNKCSRFKAERDIAGQHHPAELLENYHDFERFKKCCFEPVTSQGLVPYRSQNAPDIISVSQMQVNFCIHALPHSC